MHSSRRYPNDAGYGGWVKLVLKIKRKPEIDQSVGKFTVVEAAPFINIQNTTTPSKPLIRGSEVGCSEAKLTQCAGTHYAWLNGHVQVGFE
jgi:hypothetical protein